MKQDKNGRRGITPRVDLPRSGSADRLLLSIRGICQTVDYGDTQDALRAAEMIE